MIISHRHQFIFLKTRKTAGSSIEAALFDHLGPDDIATGSARDGTPRLNCREGMKGHVGARKIRKLAGRDAFRKYTKACFERNPWDKTVSDWLYHRDVVRDFSGTLAEYIEAGKAPQEWRKYAPLCRPVFAVFRFEDMPVAFDRLCQQIGVPRSTAPRLKANSRRDHYSRYYDDRTREMVGRLFAREIRHFGYRFEER